MTERRVVVTGIGTINPLGNNIEEYFSNLEKGVSGAAPITHFDAEKFKTKFACEVKNYDSSLYFDRKEVRKYDLFTQYALIAATQAVEDSALDLEAVDKEQVGVIWSSGIGGMTPPCAIALATLLFKNKFTKEERDAGPTNFIMGLAFITEGAIPFAASDPLHVLPSCIIGSALAGALSMAFHCTLMAPHGGIFVFPVVGNALMYLVALAAGTVVSALLLGVLKKKVA